jgi:hypothetical protein
MERLPALVIKSPEEVELILKTQNIAKWRFDEDLADLKKPVDKTKWNMSPQTKRITTRLTMKLFFRQRYCNRLL